MKPVDILKKYWGYDTFREVQEDIVNSALEGHDTLALLPTGGGKSICFQVPALMKEGITLVVSPLIALMKDQVAQLNKRKIKAYAIYTGMSKENIDITLDNCIYGDAKFLYLSPERLKTEIFRERAKKMKLAFLVVDEAHCISQWGYDFRPPYLEIGDFRLEHPGLPCLALTATATDKVRKDICDKLRFSPGKTFVKSFARQNLSYCAYEEENKDARLLKILDSVPGTAVVYTRSRRETQRIAKILQEKKLSADYYHAGLGPDVRSKKQDEWIEGRTRIIVSTNAFGMGIDKPDVRVVVHMDVPESMEAYYQEAGRAGRDGKKSYAVLLHHKRDAVSLKERWEQATPPIDTLKMVYRCLGSYFQLAVGSGYMHAFDFEQDIFCKTYKLKMNEVTHVLRKLEGQGLIQMNEAFANPSKVHFRQKHEELYGYQVRFPDSVAVLRFLLRIYGGELYADFVTVQEGFIARNIKKSEDETVHWLERLHKDGVITYIPQNQKPQLVFLTPRLDPERLPLDHRLLKERKDDERIRMEAMVRYISTKDRCRSQMLLNYFGELSDKPCGICDYCVEEKRRKKVSSRFESIKQEILTELKGPVRIETLAAKLKTGTLKERIAVIRDLLANRELDTIDGGFVDRA